MKARSGKQSSPKTPSTACVGSRAIDFDLPCTARPDGKTSVSLNDYRDRWLVLLFYPRDFSMVCPTELTALSVQYEEFLRRDCDILGVSTDPVTSHEQWITTPRSQGGLGSLAFPLASDEDGSVCQAYGVYLPRQNMALRGLFIVDPNGVLQYEVVHNLSVGRRSDEVLRVLDGLQTGGLCPENWARDESTLDPTQVLGANSVVGQYRIEQQIGSGTFGVVYRAKDLPAWLKRRIAADAGRSPRGRGAQPPQRVHAVFRRRYRRHLDDCDGTRRRAIAQALARSRTSVAGRGQEHRPPDRAGNGQCPRA
jgi:alkyl hydroperoxide reductase subunit AhpC